MPSSRGISNGRHGDNGGFCSFGCLRSASREGVAFDGWQDRWPAMSIRTWANREVSVALRLALLAQGIRLAWSDRWLAMSEPGA